MLLPKDDMWLAGTSVTVTDMTRFHRKESGKDQLGVNGMPSHREIPARRIKMSISEPTER